jgi:hypothetical protein
MRHPLASGGEGRQHSTHHSRTLGRVADGPDGSTGRAGCSKLTRRTTGAEAATSPRSPRSPRLGAFRNSHKRPPKRAPPAAPPAPRRREIEPTARVNATSRDAKGCGTSRTRPVPRRTYARRQDGRRPGLNTRPSRCLRPSDDGRGPREASTSLPSHCPSGSGQKREPAPRKIRERVES